MQEKCSCEIEDIEEHACPYEQEFDYYTQATCKCCDFCESNCAGDI